MLETAGAELPRRLVEWLDKKTTKPELRGAEKGRKNKKTMKERRRLAMAEIGRIGQKRWNGVFYEEFLRDLQGIRGVEVYREMANNDDTIGAILFAIKMLIRHTVWNIEPGGDSAKDREAAEFVESCMDDMQSTWDRYDFGNPIGFWFMAGACMRSYINGAWGKHGAPRTKSKYSDGLIGWQKLPDPQPGHRFTNGNMTGMTT